jgi:hypothetical protein
MESILMLPLWWDISPRSYAKPTVVRFRTPTSQFSWAGPVRVLYAVCGTEYGYIHTPSGEVRTWGSYSGAYRAMRRYMSIWGQT